QPHHMSLQQSCCWAEPGGWLGPRASYLNKACGCMNCAVMENGKRLWYCSVAYGKLIRYLPIITLPLALRARFRCKVMTWAHLCTRKHPYRTMLHVWYAPLSYRWVLCKT